MDKFGKIIDLITKPGNYSDEQIAQMMLDDEMRQIYHTLCDSDSAMRFQAPSDYEINAAWRNFRDSRPKASILLRRRGHLQQRAAAIVAVAISSVAVLAVGLSIGIAHKNALAISDSESKPLEATSSPANSANIGAVSCTTLPADSTMASKIIVFEDKDLNTILLQIADHYGLKLDIQNPKTAELRLFFRWDPSKTATEVARQLNNFDMINLTLKKGTLTLH